MDVLVIGSGGREHTLGWKLLQSENIYNIFFAPGNGGTNLIGTNITINILDFESIKKFIEEKNIELVVVGPEIPLVEGITDYLNANLQKVIHIIGPSAEGAKLEGSKEFAKKFMKRHNVPTARYKAFQKTEFDNAVTFMKQIHKPYVIKADGLAAGKGVLIIDNLKEASAQLKEIFSGKFGEAGEKVVIEEFLDGIELSVFVLTDGKNYKILPTSKDYKRIGESDTGLNTGGMGAVSPVPFADEALMKKIEEKIIKPTINGLAKENINYTGFLYFGLMNKFGEPYVIEYNCRLGDPETQAVIPRIKNDFADLLTKLSSGNIVNIELDISEQTAVYIVLASGGYPENYEKNKLISGIENQNNNLIFHAGTKIIENKIYSNGGRVLAITSLGNNILDAKTKTFDIIKNINFEKMYYRKDIGLDLL
ncbi:MAG: phosphoribosylamine--glycine ligase [Bacteroidota bacterium]|nr:phosphoribosylamine--glycine ligase [Bacteroidota bacterium]